MGRATSDFWRSRAGSVRLCPGGSEHSGTGDRQKTLAGGHEQSGRTLPKVDTDWGQAGRVRSDWGYPQQEALAKLQLALTSAATSTAITGRSDGLRVIGNAGTCKIGAFFGPSSPRSRPVQLRT